MPTYLPNVTGGWPLARWLEGGVGGGQVVEGRRDICQANQRTPERPQGTTVKGVVMLFQAASPHSMTEGRGGRKI